MKTMNNMTKRLVYIALLAILAVVLLPTSALAAGNVTYKGHADKFVFAPGSDQSATDLFADFTDVVPGDTMTDSVVVKNDSAEKKTVKIYLKALGADAGEDFLAQLKLSVKSGDKSLFDAAAGETAGLSDWVLLGTLKPGGSVTLDVTLTVPITMGDDYQDAIGSLQWQFMAEEIDDPDQAKVKKRIRTGDQPIVWLIGLMAAGAVTALGVGAGRKRSR